MEALRFFFEKMGFNSFVTAIQNVFTSCYTKLNIDRVEGEETHLAVTNTNDSFGSTDHAVLPVQKSVVGATQGSSLVKSRTVPKPTWTVTITAAEYFDPITGKRNVDSVVLSGFKSKKEANIIAQQEMAKLTQAKMKANVTIQYMGNPKKSSQKNMPSKPQNVLTNGDLPVTRTHQHNEDDLKGTHSLEESEFNEINESRIEELE